jgi:hypothetical protein
MSKIESLTPEQEKQMILFREEWRAHGLSTERVDKDKTKEAISKMYELIGKKPPVFIFCPSLMFAQFQIAYCKTLFETEEWSNLRSNLESNLWSNLESNLRSNLRSNLESNLESNLRSNLESNLGSNLGSNLRSNLESNLRSNLRSNLESNLWSNLRSNLGYEHTSFWGSMDAYWIAFYEFPEKFLGVEYGAEDSERLKLWSMIAKSSSWFWCYENYCFVSDRPEDIKMNSDNQLHSLSGPAIKWVDGYEIYYINGREISKKNFDLINNKLYTIHDFFDEKNEEVKSVCLQMLTELYGDNYLATFFESVLKEVNTYVDKKDHKYLEGTTKGMNIGVYTLFNGSFDNYSISYVRCYCPSTDRMFYLGVEPIYNNAKDAIASLYTCPKNLVPHIKDICRQGERFSTTFTEKGLDILNKNQDIGEPVSISGDLYFSKMKYEF